VPHSSVEAGERALPDPGERRGRHIVDRGWNHAEDTVPRKRVTAKPPDRVRDSEPTT